MRKTFELPQHLQCVLPPNLDRCIAIVHAARQLLQLDLHGLEVLTEAGSGHFLLTPIIAALSGAKRVMVWTKDSPYGAGQAIADACMQVAEALGVSQVLVPAVNQQPVDHLEAADIVTNSGALRPLDAAKLRRLKASAVIPLMYEKWELRPSDIDIDCCLKQGIHVGGTWENYPTLGIFDYCEQLIVKLALDAGYEIRGNRIIVFSSDHFGELAVSGFQKMGAAAVWQTTDTAAVLDHAAEADFIFFCDYMNPAPLLGPVGLLAPAALLEANPTIGVVHLAGDIDLRAAQDAGLAVFPEVRGEAMRMTRTLSYLGPKPVLLLQAAGLKVGECLVKGLENELVQPF